MHGPVKIIKTVNDNVIVYVIQLGDVEKVINISKLKRYDSKAVTSIHQISLLPYLRLISPLQKRLMYHRGKGLN